MNLNQVMKQFFIENEFYRLAQRVSVVRNDGIVLYSNSENFHESFSIGALVGGLWQAAEALNSMVSKDENILEFRLSFDKSNQGIYVLPFEIKGTCYFICTIYKQINNPALLKNNLRNLKDTLSTYLKSEFVQKVVDDRSGYLFNNITDAEMDKVFSFSEN